MDVKTTVIIIASCADRKRLPVPNGLMLRNVTGRDIEGRTERWCRALYASSSPVLPALDLYIGDHWSVCRQLQKDAMASGFAPALWVVSAGYGLLPASALIHAYSATFACGHQDFVGVRQPNETVDATQAWWTALQTCCPTAAPFRSIAVLAGNHPRAVILFVASPEYVAACTQDLLEARSQLSDPDRLILVTSRGFQAKAPLEDHVVFSDARMQPELGGARTSLNARVASKILREAPKHGLSAGHLRSRFQRLASSSPPLVTYDRKALSDDQVTTFIANSLRRSPGSSCTRLLRQLRDSGGACEQGRFREIFGRVQDAN